MCSRQLSGSTQPASPYAVPFTLVERDTPQYTAHWQTGTQSTLNQEPSRRETYAEALLTVRIKQPQAASSISPSRICLTRVHNL